MTKMCMRCGQNPARIKSNGQQALLCRDCKRANRANRLNGRRDLRLQHKKGYCEHCGFIALHPVWRESTSSLATRQAHPRNYD